LWNVVAPILGALIVLVLGYEKAWMQLVTGDFKGALNTLGETAKAVFGGIWDALVAFLESIAGAMGTSLSEIGKTWANIWKDLVKILKFYWNQMVAAIKTYVGNIWKQFSDWWKKVVKGFNDWVQDVRDYVKQGFENVFGVMRAALLAILGLIITILNQWLSRFGVTVKDILIAVRNGFNEVRSFIYNTMQTISQNISTVWNNIYNTVSEKVRDVYNTVSTYINNVKETIRARFEEAKTIVWGAWTSIYNFAVTWLTSIANTIKEKVQGWISVIAEKLEGFVEMGQNIVNSLRQGIEDAWDSFVSYWIGIIQDLIQVALDTFTFQSPTAKAFIDMGSNLMTSIALGIGKKGNVPADALRKYLGDLGGGAGILTGGGFVGSTSYQTTDNAPRYYAPVTYEIHTDQKSLDSILSELRVTT